jgi:hypothetical protein
MVRKIVYFSGREGRDRIDFSALGERSVRIACKVCREMPTRLAISARVSSQCRHHGPTGPRQRRRDR